MSHIENHTFDEIELGQSAELLRRLTLEDLRGYAANAAELNPEHMDRQFATNDMFHRMIAHGLWADALVATLLATELPGPGTRFVEQRLKYMGPVCIGEQVRARVEVTEKQADNQFVVLKVTCNNESGDPIVQGQVTVEAPPEKIEIDRELGVIKAPEGRHRQLQRLHALVREMAPCRTAVVHPVDDVSLIGAVEAAEMELIIPVLVGPEYKIRAIAEEHDVDLADYEIIDTEHSHEAAEKAVAMARAEKVEALMKGKLHTDELMSAVVKRDTGLRTGRRMSHAWVMDVPTYPRPLIITDSAINIQPDLMTKADILQNAIELAQAMGIAKPKVAILSATESVNPAIPSTIDAAALCKMSERGQIEGAVLDGPLAFDNAISEAAARTKGIHSPVAGRADILLAPDLEAGNMIGKQLHYLADAEPAGIVLGARVPIVLTSRADDAQSRMASCALGLLMADRKRKRG